MDQVGEDVWSLQRISTRFKVEFDSGHPRSIGGSAISFTSARGLGWRFGITVLQSGLEGMRYKIEFHIDATSVCSDLGSLTIRVYLEAEDTGGVKMGRQELSTLSLPADGSKLVADWDPTDNIRSLHLEFTVAFTMPLQRPRPIDNSAALGDILQESMSSGAFVDTKLYIFTRRTPSCTLTRPKPLFVSAKLLQDKLDYFKTNMYRESLLLPLDGDFPTDRQPYVYDYDYDPDSDLEETDEESDLLEDEALSVDGFDFVKAGPMPSDEDIYSPEQMLPGAFNLVSSPQPDPRDIDIGQLREKPVLFERRGRIVFIKDAAFDTWQALLFYLYAGDITFRPLKSQQEPREKVNDSLSSPAAGRQCPPSCSPKSMYRLADKLGLDSLKGACLSAIRGALSEKNIVHECFSRFTYMYHEVQTMEFDLLCEWYDAPEVKDAFPRIMKEIADGEYPHSSAILPMLLERLGPRVNAPTPQTV